MKIVLPANSSHDVIFIPRIYPTGVVVLSLYNEATKVTTTPSNSYVIESGYLTITFTDTFAEGDKYQIKITEGTGVIFRGKLLATAQETQKYQLTDGLYYYE